VTLRKFGLDKLADSLTDTRMKATHMAGGWVLDYQKAMAGLTKEERVMVGGVLEGKLDPTEVNGVFPGLQEVLPNVRDSMHRNIVDAATNVRSILDNVGNLFQEHGVPVFDGGSQQLHAFAFRDGFVPHRIVNVAQFLEPGALQNQAVQAVIKAGQASDRAGAISWLSDLAKQAHGDYAELIKTGNAGSQIKARLVGLPGYEQDLDLTMPQYLESSARRIATFAKFGRGPIMPDSPELTGALRDLYPRAFDEVDKMNGPMGRVANDILTTYMGKAKQPSLFMTYIGRPLGGVNVATKMPLAAISRVSHVLWGVARTQYQGALGNMFKVVSGDPETWDFAMKSGAILRGVVKDSQDRLMGGGNLGSQRLNETWFTPVDTAARAFGAVQGATFARIQAKALYKFATEEGVGVENVLNTLKGAHIAERLSKIGINPQEVINQAGHLSEEQTLTAGASIAHDVNFWGDSLSLPGMFRSPEGRFFLQFKTFAAQQGAMVKDNFVKPAMEWVRSNGDRGEIGPLLRAATVAGFGGEAISDIKSMFQLRKRPTDVLERFAEDISNMATLGLYGDAWKAASRGYEGMASFVAGPTVDSLLRLGDATGKAVTGKTPKRFQPLERWAMGNVLPMVHPALAVASRGLESQFLPTKNDQPLGANEGRPTRPVRTARPGRAKR
jgi:hypothetical protein